MEKTKFELLKEKYGNFSSFAIWPNEKSVDDLTIFEDSKTLERLNEDFIIVALNPAKGKRPEEEKPVKLKNFHSDYYLQKDYKLCHALIGTVLWGSYLTDLFKSFRTSDSEELRLMLKDPERSNDLKKDIESFLDEIKIINENATLVAIGSETYRQLKNLAKTLNLKNRIIKIIHYAHHYNGMHDPEIYRKSVLAVIENNLGAK